MRVNSDWKWPWPNKWESVHSLLTSPAIILQSVRFNNQCYRTMITDLMKKLFLPQKHDSAVSRAGVVLIPSAALQEHLGWDKTPLQSMRKRCFWNRLGHLGYHNYQIHEFTDRQCDIGHISRVESSCCFCIAHVISCLYCQLYRSIQLQIWEL